MWSLRTMPLPLKDMVFKCTSISILLIVFILYKHWVCLYCTNIEFVWPCEGFIACLIYNAHVCGCEPLLYRFVFAIKVLYYDGYILCNDPSGISASNVFKNTNVVIRFSCFNIATVYTFFLLTCIVVSFTIYVLV